MGILTNKIKSDRKAVANLMLRSVLFLCILLILIAVFTIGVGSYRIDLHEGDIASKDIFAPFDFKYYGEVNLEVTEKLRDRAADRVKIVFDIDEEAQKAIYGYLEGLFVALESSRGQESGEEEKLAQLRDKFPELKEGHLAVLLGLDDLNSVRDVVNRVVKNVISKPIILRADLDELRKDRIKEIVLRNLKEKSEEVIGVNSLILDNGAKRALLNESLIDYFKDDGRVRSAVSDILDVKIGSNLKKSADEFLRRVNEVKAGIPEVLNEVDVKKDEIILGKGQRVKKRHLRQLEMIFGKVQGARERVGGPLSMSVVLFLLLVITAVTLRRYGPKVYNNNSYLLLIAVISIVLLIGARVITASFLSSYFIPIAAASMLLVILLNENVAFLMTLMLSIGCGIIVGNKLDMMIICLIGGAVGVYSVRGLRKRFQLLQAGFLVGCANFIIISSFGVLKNLQPNVFLVEAGIGFINGTICSFIVMGLLPVFEYLFKITTDITLLELSDLNHPLLKELTLKAPGTYHHSLLVGNLAEAACDAVGANSLMARVGAYYHDIGKIEKAEYFGENIVEGASQHDKLSASMSALVITNHVKDGAELARKHKLSQAIVDFIQQHHGNTLIYYFYQRALEKATDETQLKEENFRYPGPRPQTKETAIVLLADAVEASSRTLSKPTPARIESLVRKIINNKFIDGQLDDCELTLKDLNKIAGSFVRVLTGVFHSRVEYPEVDEKPRVKNNSKDTRKESHPKQSPSQKDNTKNA